MSRTLAWWAALLLALFAPAAHAQCEGTWNNERVSRNLDEVAAALGAADLDTAKRKLKETDQGLGCLEELIDRKVLARFGRSVGLLRFYEQDEPQSIRWGLLARILDAEGPWPGDVPEDHPYREMLAEEEDPPKGRAEGWLIPPEKGGVFLNGEFLPEPEAYAELPGLVQLFDRVGYPLETFWQDGAAFREGLTGPEGGPVEVPKYYNPETGELKVGEGPAKVKSDKIPVEKPPSDFPVVPVATAGGLAVLSGISYAIAAGTAGGLDEAPTTADLARIQGTTNIFVLVSAITGAGAVGVGVGTVLADARGVAFTVRF